MGQHKTRLVGWHPSDPAAVAWLDAEIARRGGGRGAQSAILDGALEKIMTGTAAAPEPIGIEWLIARARELSPVYRRGFNDRDCEVGWLLLELADRLQAVTPQQPL